MFSKKKNTGKLELEQRELYNNARRRALEKKRLFQHFVTFLIGCVFLIILNVVIGYQKEFQPLGYDWFVWAVLLWAFVLMIHFFNVYVINSFMGKEWEAKQMEKLVKKQEEKIESLRLQVEKEHPLPEKNTMDEPIVLEDPDRPTNT